MIEGRIDPVSTHARTHPERPACVDLASGRSWSYAALDRDSNRLAAWLVERLGPASGERVALLSRNSAEMLILHLASIRAGAVFVPLNWRLALPELSALAEDCNPALLFFEAGFSDIAWQVTPDAAFRPIEELASLEAGAQAPPEAARRDWEEPATLLYTSGTSGRPKGVIFTEANAFFSCANFLLTNDVDRDSVFLCDMPLFHTAGLFAATRVPLLAGGSVLISRGFEPELTLARLSDPELAVSHYFSVPQMAQVLAQLPAFEPERLQRLKIWSVGGAPLPAALAERMIRAGVPLSNGFGMSETGSNFAMPMNDPERALAKAGSCGLPHAFVETRIVDDDGVAVAEGETGELWVAGPSVSPGYWNRPEENARAHHGRWFKTGDAAWRDEDGFYYLVDRKKDMFISGGENVYPAEVEAALAEMHELAEAAVIGVPDARWGEVGRAYVILRDGAEIDAERIGAHCRTRLARYKVPATIVITDTIPRTASGKVQKHVLRRRALEEMGHA